MDQEIAGVGTANFDNRSFRLNFEITVLAHDRHFTGQVADMLIEDLAQCREVSQEEIDNKPPWFPLAMSIARLFSPVL